MTPEDSLTDDHVLVSRHGPVVTLTFNRPQARNALTWAMYERLYETCEQVDADDSVRVLVLRGAGGKAFIAGTDIAQFTAFTTAADGLAYERELERRVARLERVAKPVIAQIQGFATGGGLEIAAACDLRIATPDAQFGVPIARTLGNCLSMEAYSRFVDLLGPSRVKDLLLTARLLSADEARSAGFARRRSRADHPAGEQGGDSPGSGAPPPDGRRGSDRLDVRERGFSRGGSRVRREAQATLDRPIGRSGRSSRMS